jgi:hypothetical protein
MNKNIEVGIMGNLIRSLLDPDETPGMKVETAT